MKKVFYNSWITRALLCLSNCHTITLTAFVFSKQKKGEMTQATRNHERTHARQWAELTVLTGIILLATVLAFDISTWWLLTAGLTFYVWYALEYIIRGMIYSVTNDDCQRGECKDAYRMISFEQEARKAEHDANYLENCNYFNGWLRCVFK